MLNARNLVAAVAGIVLSLGMVAQAEQEDYCVLSVDKGNGTLTVVEADELSIRNVGCDPANYQSAPKVTVKLAPHTNYIQAHALENEQEHDEWYHTEEDFLFNVRPGDLIEVEGNVSSPDQIWLHRIRY